MKALQISASLALAMALGVVVSVVAAADVMAISSEKYADVTKTQLDAAIAQAEQALAKEMSSKFDGDKAYLQKLVDQAKVLTADFAANVDKNLGELVAALSEGAQVLVIRANADAQSGKMASTQAEAPAVTQAVYTSVEGLPETSVGNNIRLASQTTDNQVAGVISEENRLKLEAQNNNNGGTRYSGNSASTSQNSQGGSATTGEKTENDKDSNTNSDEIAVPQTGETLEGAKPSGLGVGLIVAGAALFAGASAMFLARKARKRG